METTTTAMAATATTPPPNNNIISNKKLKLATSDGKVVQAEESAVRKLESLRNLLEDRPSWAEEEGEIRVADVRAKALRQVLAWCKKHAAAEKKRKFSPEDAERLEKWDREFAAGLGDIFVLEVALAADLLGAPTPLISLAMARIAEAIGDMSVEQVRQGFAGDSDDKKPKPAIGDMSGEFDNKNDDDDDDKPKAAEPHQNST